MFWAGLQIGPYGKELSMANRQQRIWVSLDEDPSSVAFIYLFICLFICLFIWGPYPQHMEVPRPVVKSELQLPQHQIRAASPTYTTAHGNAGSLTHWVGPGIKSVSSWILVKFITAESQRGLLPQLLLDDCGLSWHLFFFSHAHSTEKFLGQGSNLCYSSDDTRSLIHWATRELPWLTLFV